MDLKNIIEARDKRQKNQEAKKELENIKMERYQRHMNNRLAKEKEHNEHLKEQKIRFQEFVNRGDIISTIRSYRKVLTHIFKHFSRIDDIKLSNDMTHAINTLDPSKF